VRAGEVAGALSAAGLATMEWRTEDEWVSLRLAHRV